MPVAAATRIQRWPPLRPECGVPVAAAARIQRWCLFLAACNYDIQFRSTGKHANCDGLSRLPCVEGHGNHANCNDLSRLPCAEGPTSSESADQVDVFSMSQIQSDLPSTVKSAHDTVLARVVQAISTGNWSDLPSTVESAHATVLACVVQAISTGNWSELPSM